MDKDLKLKLESVLKKHIDTEKNQVFVFGSRANNQYKDYSDIDIGISGDPVSGFVMEEIREDFENSNVPYVVDLVDFNDVSAEFSEEANKHLIRLLNV